jgi:hypothetical protein
MQNLALPLIYKPANGPTNSSIKDPFDESINKLLKPIRIELAYQA